MEPNISQAVLVLFVIIGIGGSLAFIPNGTDSHAAIMCIGIHAFVIALIASVATRATEQWNSAFSLHMDQFRVKVLSYHFRNPANTISIAIRRIVPIPLGIRSALYARSIGPGICLERQGNR
jgi:hypothetical protein